MPVDQPDGVQIGTDFRPEAMLQHWLTPDEFRGWCKGNAIVSLAREGNKGGDDDIEKAIDHLKKLLGPSRPERHCPQCRGTGFQRRWPESSIQPGWMPCRLCGSKGVTPSPSN